MVRRTGARQTAPIDILLVHSPLVAPSSMTPLGDALRTADVRVHVPDLRAPMGAPRQSWRRFVSLAVEAGADVAGPLVVVGHSGGGVMLPLIADALRPAATVFLDAVVPGNGAQHVTSAGLRTLLDGLPADDTGLLPPWHEWWPTEMMARLVPSPEQRRVLTADIARVPRSFYDDAVPLPGGWATRPGNAYLQLGPAYDDDRARAVELGWPTDAIDGGHLDAAVRPALVAAHLIPLIYRATL